MEILLLNIVILYKMHYITFWANGPKKVLFFLTIYFISSNFISS